MYVITYLLTGPSSYREGILSRPRVAQVVVPKTQVHEIPPYRVAKMTQKNFFAFDKRIDLPLRLVR